MSAKNAVAVRSLAHTVGSISDASAKSRVTVVGEPRWSGLSAVEPSPPLNVRAGCGCEELLEPCTSSTVGGGVGGDEVRVGFCDDAAGRLR